MGGNAVKHRETRILCIIFKYIIFCINCDVFRNECQLDNKSKPDIATDLMTCEKKSHKLFDMFKYAGSDQMLLFVGVYSSEQKHVCSPSKQRKRKATFVLSLSHTWRRLWRRGCVSGLQREQERCCCIAAPPADPVCAGVTWTWAEAAQPSDLEPTQLNLVQAKQKRKKKNPFKPWERSCLALVQDERGENLDLVILAHCRSSEARRLTSWRYLEHCH